MKLAVALITVYLVWGSTFLASPSQPVAAAAPDALGALPHRRRAALRLVAWRGDVATERPGSASGSPRRSSARPPRVDTGGVAWAEQRVASGTTRSSSRASRSSSRCIDRAFFGIRLGFGAVAGSRPASSASASSSAREARRPARRRGHPLRVVCLGRGLGVRPCCAPAARPVLRAAMQMLLPAPARRAGLAMGEAAGSIRRDLRGVARRAPVPPCLRLPRRLHRVRLAAPERSTPLLSTYAYVNPAVAVFLGWAFVGEHVGAERSQRAS